jgi:tetratricopeptide (TPR) repeat protein
MENEWKKAFNMARQLIFEKNKEDYVKQLLMPFRGVSEKTPLIQSLFNEKEIYQLLKQKLAKKDFKGFFELIHRFPFLADLDEYKEALKFGEKLLKAANNYIQSGDYSKVLQYVNMLRDFPMYQKDAEEILNKANVLVNFMKYMANKEYDKVYEYVKKEPFLENVEDFKHLEDEWQKRVEIAEEYSAKGDVTHIIDILKNYMKIKEKLPKIGELIKTAYLYQILEKLKSENLDDETVQKAFNRYIKLFGLDPEIGDIIEFAKKAGYKLDFSNIEEGDSLSWIHEELPSSIFS